MFGVLPNVILLSNIGFITKISFFVAILLLLMSLTCFSMPLFYVLFCLEAKVDHSKALIDLIYFHMQFFLGIHTRR